MIICCIILILQSHTKGLTRDIKFDHKGHRTDFFLDIIELGPAGLEKVGIWNSTEGLASARAAAPFDLSGDDGSLRNRSFIVITALVRFSILI